MAEREGFEPSEEVSPLTRLAGERLQPARPSLQVCLKYYALIVIRTIVIQQFRKTSYIYGKQAWRRE